MSALETLLRTIAKKYPHKPTESAGVQIYLSDGHWYGVVVMGLGRSLHNIRVDEEQGVETLIYNMQKLVENDQGEKK